MNEDEATFTIPCIDCGKELRIPDEVVACPGCGSEPLCEDCGCSACMAEWLRDEAGGEG